MLDQYLPVLILLVLATGVAGVLLLLSRYAGPRQPSRAKSNTYECGIEPVGNARGRFPVRFYLVAMLFIAFDIEIVFLYPWAVTFDVLGLFGFVEMVLFILTVFIAYAYVWRRGGLEWD